MNLSIFMRYSRASTVPGRVWAYMYVLLDGREVYNEEWLIFADSTMDGMRAMLADSEIFHRLRHHLMIRQRLGTR